jgi:hypothetical protein
VVKARVYTNLDGPDKKNTEVRWEKVWDVDFPAVPAVGDRFIRLYHGGDKEAVLQVVAVNWREIATGIPGRYTCILEVELNEAPRSKFLG